MAAMAPEHGKPASSSASSSSYTSGDEEGVEAQFLTQDIPISPPARHESVGEENEDEASEEGDLGGGDPIKRQLPQQQPTPPQRSPEDCDGESSDDLSNDSDSDSDSDSEEVESAPEPRTHVDLTKPSLLKRTAEAAGIVASSSSNKRVPAAKEVAKPLAPEKPVVAKQVTKLLAPEKTTAAKEVAKLLVPEKTAAAKQATMLLVHEKTAAAKEVAKPPLPKKKPPPPKNKAAAALTKHANPPKKAAAVPKEKSSAAVAVAAATAIAKLPVAQGTEDAPSGPEDNQVQKCMRLKEKSERYWFVWQQKQALEVELKQQPGMFDDAFLRMDDAEATMMNNMIKKQMVDECRLNLKRFDIKKLVNKALCDLM